ncbi:hypothetical protein SEUCBS139899_002816 [Sporothrix eucalyptigena]|uniref:Major facilitator superfamily (MFS) profile domain-containing protein n=1 Tax=Sporothrix eucalyptigena TaxID=1812306 RepID=A0ABP0CFY1_9PEZI
MASKSSIELERSINAATATTASPVHQVLTAETETVVIGYETDLDKLPLGYYRSRFFLGSMLAVGLGLWCAVSCFGFAAPILAQINDDLGPDPRYIWISLVYNAVLAPSLVLVGRLSDIFGRRYWFIGGGVFGVVGAIVCATAKTIPMLIGGNVLLGMATATQMSFHFVMGELVPMRFRYIGNAFLYCFTFPGSGVAPSISYSFIERAGVSWRGVYWLILGGEAAALACWTLFYFPPSFNKMHAGEAHATKTYWIQHFDYVGMVLFSGGFVVFLLGLSWGGTVYPWKSAGTIASIVVGVVVLIAFVLWELYAPLREPLIPMHLFRNTEWVAACVLLGLGAGVYYAFAIIWPSQAAVMYGRADGDLTYLGGISNIVGLGIIGGQITGGLLAEAIGKTKIQVMVVFGLGGVFLACMATTTPDTKGQAIALLTIGCFFIGWNESICLANATICVRNQREIGVAGGMAGSIRAAICAVLETVYITVLSNRLTQTIADQVPPALVDAGLPSSSVEAFLSAVAVGTSEAFAAVPGATASIIAVGMRAYKVANSDAYRTVYLTTIAFSSLAMVMTLFAPNTEKYMTSKVVATLHNEDNTFAGTSEKKLEEQA